MQGMVVDGDPKPVVEKFREYNVLALTAGGNVVRFLPTLSMKDSNLEQAVDMMTEALDELYGVAE